MSFDNDLTHPNSDTVSISQKAQKDYFENADAHTTRVILPDNLGVLEAYDKRISVPPQLAGSLLIKSLHYLLHHVVLSPITLGQYIGYIKRVFDYMSAHPSAYAVKDPIFMVQVVSNAIKDMDKGDKIAYRHQRVFFNAIGKVNRNGNFTTAEQKLYKAILKHTVVFENVKSTAKKTISELHPEFVFTDRQYIDSIRTIALTYHAVWSAIRAEFKSEMPSEYAELRERIIKTPSLVDLVSSSIPALSKFNIRNTYYGSPLKDEVIWIRQLLIQVANTLKNDYFTEALFLSKVYSQVHLRAEHLDQQPDRLALKSQIDHPTMLGHLSKWLFQNPTKLNGKSVLMQAVFSPLCLLLPWGSNELGLYATFLLTDRVGPTSVRNISLKQFTWLDRNHVKTTQELASRATIRGIYKGRQKKTTDLEITDRTKPLFHLLSELYSSYNAAIDEGLIDPAFMKPFEQLFSGKGQAADTQLLGRGLFKQAITNSGLAPLVVKGTALYENIQSLNVPAFHELMIAGSQRMSDRAKDRLNLNRPEWRIKRAFLAPTAITQSRVIADQFVDLNDTRISEDMTFQYSEEFYTKTQQKADAQFHSIETRLNVYYQRANSKLVVECRERFAAQVGDEMVKMAMEMAIIASESNAVVTLEQARAVCGLGDIESEITPEELVSQVDAQEALINDTAFITPANGSKTYIIRSDMHAFLMAAKIHHIDASINDLLLSNERLVPRAIARRMLLMMLLSEFEKPMVNRANQRLNKMLTIDPSAISRLW
jgi:hypothetical protein